MNRSETVLSDWETWNTPYLETCRGRRLLVAYSGGKDSTVLLELLRRVQPRWGFELEAHLYPFPRQVYPEVYREMIVPFWSDRGVRFVYHETEQDDSVLEKELLATGAPCLTCQRIRKRFLASFLGTFHDSISSIVLTSGHSLWDLAGYALERFIARELVGGSDPESSDRKAAGEERHREIAQRFYPFLTMQEGYSVFRPMLCLNQEDIEGFLTEENLPVQENPCRYTRKRPKKMLAEYFREFGFQFTYAGIFDFADRHLDIPDEEEITRLPQGEFLSKRF